MKLKLYLVFAVIIGTIIFVNECNTYWEHKKFVESDTLLTINTAEELEKAYNSNEKKRYFVKEIVPERVVCTMTKDSITDYIIYQEIVSVKTSEGKILDCNKTLLYADSLYLTKNIVLTKLKDKSLVMSEFKKIETPDTIKTYYGIFANNNLSFIACIGAQNIEFYTEIRKDDSDAVLEGYYSDNSSSIFEVGILLLFPLIILIYFIYRLVKKAKKNKRIAYTVNYDPNIVWDEPERPTEPEEPVKITPPTYNHNNNTAAH